MCVCVYVYAIMLIHYADFSDVELSSTFAWFVAALLSIIRSISASRPSMTNVTSLCSSIHLINSSTVKTPS